MKTPFPLFARLLLWFFVNLLILIAGFLVMVRVQFGSLDNWLLPQSSQAQIQAMCTALVGDLVHSPKKDWGGKLYQLSGAYKMDFALYDSHGNWMSGAELNPPEEIHRALLFAQPNRPPPGQGPPPPRDEGNPPPDDRLPPPEGRPPPPDDGPPPPQADGRPPDGQGPPPPRHRIPDFPKTVLRSSSPADYWLLVRFPPEPFHSDGPISLVGRTPELGISPLLFNPKPWIGVAAGVVIFSILFWLPLARNLTNSIIKMTRATESIAEGRFDIQLADTRRDELGRLSGAINRMAVRLKNYVTGQKRFLGDAAHELCSPLARMEVALSILEERSDAKALPYVKDVREEVTHMRKLANELLSFSKAALGENLKIEPIRLADVVEAAIRQEKIDAGAIEVKVPASLYGRGHFESLERAVANLLRNAQRYAGTAGPISVAGWEECDHVYLMVADQGPGVSPHEIGKLFDPFYRVDESRTTETGGVGLGLAIVKTCVEACGGVVTAENRRPTGLEVRIRLDRVDKVS